MLSTAMVFGLAACGGGNDKEATTDAGSEDKQEAADKQMMRTKLMTRQ